MTHFFILMWPARLALPEMARLSKSEFTLFLRGVDADRYHPLRAKGLGISMLASIILPVIFVVLVAAVLMIGFKVHVPSITSLLCVVCTVPLASLMTSIISSYLNARFNRAELIARFNDVASLGSSALPPGSTNSLAG